MLAYRGPLGGPLGALLGRLGGRLAAILGVLERSLDVSRPSWTVSGASGSEKVVREDAGDPRGTALSPKRFGSLGSGPLKDSSGLRTEA